MSIRLLRKRARAFFSMLSVCEISCDRGQGGVWFRVAVLNRAFLEQFHIENVDCSGSRESDYPQPNTRKNHAFSVV